ncbi:protein kinase [Streptomyces sp. NBC_01478]|uniref:protein kinase domain-containing protein n=1 Tax=Streptomyces sp. NBC_01478 TaxID=2903882 RepID=UPI002E3223FD|nr:protein kinase [Streptomyces sp. NBC_01478]
MLSLDGSDPSHIGRYRLVGRLGEGGMGRVYLARSPGGRPAAVKVINDHLRHDEHALSRFRREVETLGTVRSAYTASLIDAELDTPPYWLATEYVPGPTLHTAVATNGPLPADLARVMLAALAEGLDAIHVRGVWHRDLKPHNVILSATGPQLIDFGIARTIGTSNLTQAGGAMGSPGFIAPETITSGETGPGADVFALGATLAFAVTGRPPYGDGPFAAVSYRSVHGELDLRGVDPAVAELIAACAQSDPALRPTPQRIVELCRADADLVHHPAYQRALAVGSLTDRERAATVADNGGGGSPGAHDVATALAPPATTAAGGHAATLLAPNPGYTADFHGPYPAGTLPPLPPDAGGTRRGRGRRGLWTVVGAAALVVVTGSGLLVFHALDDKGDSKGSASAKVTPSAGATHGSAAPSESAATTSPSPSPSATGGGNLPDAVVVKSPYTFEAGTFVQTARSKLIMQPDGNLVLYDASGTAHWASQTQGAGNTAVFQEDGNFVVYSAQHQSLWASNTQGADGATLKVLETGNMVIATDAQVVWQTDTAF